jgi:hypothetical protein
MNLRRSLTAFGANTWVVTLLIAGCGDYGGSGDDDDTAVGGTAASQATGGVGAGGTTPTGGVGAVGAGGGGAAPASCDQAQPCGGDVVGTWTVMDACVAITGEFNLTGLGVGCAFATVTATSLEVSGTWTANADMTYEDDLVWTGEQTFELAPECQHIEQVTCDRLDSALVSLGYLQGLTYDDVTCTPVGPDPYGGCSCTAVIDSPGGSTGTYTVAGHVLTTSNGAEYSYCVKGNTLTLTPTKFATGTSTKNTGAIVLQK